MGADPGRPRFGPVAGDLSCFEATPISSRRNARSGFQGDCLWGEWAASTAGCTKAPQLSSDSQPGNCSTRVPKGAMRKRRRWRFESGPGWQGNAVYLAVRVGQNFDASQFTAVEANFL